MQELLITEKSADYELLDSGEGEKLERYGKIILSRPDPQAIWQKNLKEEWDSAHATFVRTGQFGKWQIKGKIPESWGVKLGGFNFSLELLPSKHLGVFPEQSPHWHWLEEKIKKSKREISVLNLFGYTGGATMAVAKAGASVCHVDASKFAVDLAGKNLKSSGLGSKPVRFIVDDARKFVEREIKRKNKYDVILLDPPIYGKGNKGETWKLENDLLPLVLRLKEILSPKPLAIILNGYSSIYSGTTYTQILQSLNLPGKIDCGELAIRESSGKRLLPTGIFTRYEG